MDNLLPTVPKKLNAFARELLASLAGHPEAAEIVLGGGVALSHYLEYRDTVDLDAWWKTGWDPRVVALVERCMKGLAEEHGLGYRRRSWGETESLELLQGRQKLFSFQISQRTRYLDETLPTEWPPVGIETLRDNVGSKMTALVERGAPRDLLDIHELCHRGLVTVADCWRLWQAKNPDCHPAEGPEKVLFHVERLDLQRPLSQLPAAERERAAKVRKWYREVLCPSALS